MDITTKKKLNNGIEIPLLGLGTWQLSEGKEAEQAVISALETGYRHIDTAAIYGNEESVGKAVRESGIPRNEIFVTTKLATSQEDVRSGFEQSLEKLGFDYVDLYLIHSPRHPNRVGAWKDLENFVTQGLAKAVGVSNYSIKHMEETIALGGTIPTVNQVEFSPFLYQQALREYCVDRGIALEAYSPLTRGEKFGHPIVQEVAQKHHKSAAQILLRWALQHDVIVVPKSSSRQRIEENSQVFDFAISSDDMAKLDGLNENFRVVSIDPETVP